MIYQWTRSWADSLNVRVVFEEATRSTNELAKSFEYPSEDLVVFLTNHQTHGRGRGTNSWTDLGQGGELLSSWSFALNQAPQPIASPLMGRAVAKALHAVFPTISIAIKAPNDILANGKKLAGILIETISQGEAHRLIMGLGLNGWGDNAGIAHSISLAKCLGREPFEDEWTALLSHLLVNFTDAISASMIPEMRVEAINELLLFLNANPKLNEKYSDIMPDGTLISGGQVTHWTQL